MQTQNYSPDMAANFYAQLQRALTMVPQMKAVYECYGNVFRQLLLLNTDMAGIHFAGLFARTDYLLKEHGATTAQQSLVNAMRTRLRERYTLSDEEMVQHWRADLKALALFICLIYKQAVPDAITKEFPADVATTMRPKVQANAWRMIVERWDEAFIYGKIDQAPAYMNRVAYMSATPIDGNQMPGRSYLRPLLSVGTQLNLIRPVEMDGTIYPELIVYEPDMLMDVSSVAACFAPCGATPLHFLLQKMKARTESAAITMGNLASQKLDDEVNSHGHRVSLQESATRFYRRGAVSMLTSGVDDDAEQFWTEAARQQDNIHRAICELLPMHLDGFDVRNIALEPSFFCETLGLQGRMDMLQLDHRMVLEQKSGKSGFPQKDPDTPISQQSHYVQLLLYMMMLRYGYRDIYDKNHHRLSAFLMYSKYKNSLISLGYAPQLAFEAMRIRNCMAWSSRHFATEGFQSIERLDSSRFFIDPKSARLFENYVRPDIESTLATVQQADPLAKAYYYRFMRFVALEHLLAKIGTPGREDSGFAALWSNALDDKLQAGNIIIGMRLREPSSSHQGSVETVRLQIDATLSTEESNFREGDIVVLYPYADGMEPDVRRQMVFRCTISSIEADSISLLLRAPQADSHILRCHAESRWAIEHDLMESSYSGLYRGIYALLQAPKERLDLILARRQPKIDANRQLHLGHNIDGSDFNDLALRIRQSRDIYLVLGPPGSGKTSYALTCAVSEELADADGSVLLMAYTNRAVDEICSKLDLEGIDYIRVGSRLNCAEPYRKHLLEEISLTKPKLRDLRATIMNCRVMVGTTTSMTSHISLCQMRHFSMAVVDEASQILEPHLLPLLAAQTDGRCAIDRFVLIGDHKQLPAVVKQKREESVVTDPQLHNIGLMDCRESIFQRFYRLWGDRDEVASMLTRQGRMHSRIADFPAHEYYSGLLGEAPLKRLTADLPQLPKDADAMDRLILSNRVAFVDVEPQQDGLSDKVNTVEAELIALMAHRIYMSNKEEFDPNFTLGIIVPYRNQISVILSQIRKRFPMDAGLDQITIDTVERYQGSQRNFIIYGTTVQQYYQLKFLTDTCFTDSDGSTVDRKLNVAITRAREHLYIIGCRKLLSMTTSYSRFIDYCDRNHCSFANVLTAEKLIQVSHLE